MDCERKSEFSCSHCSRVFSGLQLNIQKASLVDEYKKAIKIIPVDFRFNIGFALFFIALFTYEDDWS